MTDKPIDQYKKRVDELGQALLDVIASVSLGDLNVSVDIPDDIEVFADIGIGLEFMIEDLRELAKDQQKARQELEQRISQRTRELENTLTDLQKTQKQLLQEGWDEFTSEETLKGLKFDQGESSVDENTWLPGMDQAVDKGSTSVKTNGTQEQSLSLPIQLLDQTIGVIGFNRPEDQPFTEREIATVETIVEQIGLALENQRLFDQTQTALTDSDGLYKASAELNVANTYHDILKVVHDYTTIGQQANNLSIGLFDTPWKKKQPPESVNILARITGTDSGGLEDDHPILNISSLKEILKSDEPTIILDIAKEDNLDAPAREVLTQVIGAKSLIFLPLVVGGNWIGYVNSLYSEKIQFTEDDIRRASAMGTQVSVAVLNLRNIEIAEQRALESQQRSDELAIVNRIVSNVAATIDLRESLEIVVTELNRAIPVFETGAALINDENNALNMIAFASNQKGAPTLVGSDIPINGNPSVQQVIDTKTSQIFLDARNNPQTALMHPLFKTRQWETLVLVPIAAGPEVIGVINMGLKEEHPTLSGDEMRIAETIVLQASTAIQNSRLFDQTQTALTETANLYQASAELNTAQTFEDISSILQRYSIAGQNSDYVNISLFSENWTEENTPQSIIPSMQWTKDLGKQSAFENFPHNLSEWESIDEILKSDRMILIEDLRTDERVDKTIRNFFVDQIGSSSFLSVPLVSAGQWIGQILASFPAPVAASASDIRRLMAMSGQAAVTIQNIRLLDETARRAGQLATAAEIAREASGTLEVETLLNKAVNLVRDRFGYYHASIFLTEGLDATVRASTGEAGRQLVESKHTLKAEIGGSIIGNVTFTGEPLVVNDVKADPTHRPHPLLPDTRAEIGIPLKIGHRIIGALDVQAVEVNAFNDDDIAVLQTLVDQIAVAVDNARSFEVAQAAVEEMREVDRLKSEFLANMSHELRTPLNSIIGFSRVILKGIDGPINDLQEQDLESIHNSGQHLLDLINNILDLSKIEAGKMELSIEEVPLKDIINSTVSTARGLVQENAIRLLDETPDDLPVVLADRTRLRQILLNLLQNATKFIEGGHIKVFYDTVTDEETGSKMAQLKVEDTGIGISQEDQSKLFQRFSQVDSSLTRKVGGSGLGLSITQHLVEMQGGKIWLESEEGKGSTFFFTIPIVGEIPETESTKDEIITEERKIVVSIDDDEKVINLYRRYLGTHGFQVVAITDPTIALDQVKKIKPHAITVDIMMPNKDGWQVIGDIKADPETKDIPVVICSIVEDKDKGFSLGASDYLVKPILEDEMVNSIKRLRTNGNSKVQEILVIDDDPDVHQLVERSLQSTGNDFKFRFASGGMKGLEEIKKSTPDAVILDLFMPDLDGFSVLETMKGDAGMKKIPVIILTSADLKDEERELLNNYKQELLKKDFLKPEELKESIDRAMNNIKEAIENESQS